MVIPQDLLRLVVPMIGISIFVW